MAVTKVRLKYAYKIKSLDAEDEKVRYTRPISSVPCRFHALCLYFSAYRINIGLANLYFGLFGLKILNLT